MKKIEGIIVPMVTPLTEDYSLDVSSLEKLIEHLISAGVAGIFPAGTTGGGPMMSTAMQKELCRETVRCVAGRCPVLMGVSSASPEESLAMARYAAEVGADMIVAAAPCYIPLDAPSVFGFYKLLSEKQSLPVYIYNMPSMTKTNMSPQLVAQVASLPNMAGYKDSSGDMLAFHEVLWLLKDKKDFSMMMGPEVMMSDAVIQGASGGVSAGANLHPEFFVNCFNAAKAGKLNEMKIWQEKITILDHTYTCPEFKTCGVEIALKIGLNRIGICSTVLLPPLTPVTNGMTNFVYSVLDQL